MGLDMLVSVLIGVVVILVLAWAIRTVCRAVGAPQPIETVLLVILAVLALIWLLRLLGVAVL